MKEVDVYVAPVYSGLLVNNLTGYPCVVFPDRFSDEKVPLSIKFVGNLYGEGKLLQVASLYQKAMEMHRIRPPGF